MPAPVVPATPFWAAVPARAIRTGNFWVPGERVTVGSIYEKNSDEALQPVLRWLAARMPAAPSAG